MKGNCYKSKTEDSLEKILAIVAYLKDYEVFWNMWTPGTDRGYVKVIILRTFIFHKYADFCLQCAYDKCFWKTLMTNFIWSLILKSSSLRENEVVSSKEKTSKEIFKSFLNTVLPRKDNMGTKSSLWNRVYNLSKLTHLYYISSSPH